jgi:hypothetical protein
VLGRLRAWLGVWLVPALLVASSTDSAYALFECSMSGQTGAHCCCPAQDAEAPCEDQLERASCCSERAVHVRASRADLGASPMPAVAAGWFVRLAVRDLYAVEQAGDTFSPREAPRALGPPLIVLYRVLRL